MRCLPLIFLLACATSTEDEGCAETCPSGEVCASGACFPAPCGDAIACPVGFECVGGHCAAAERCVRDSDCPGGRCVDGECFADQCEEGMERDCGNECGAGFERCVTGVWRPCTARRALEVEGCGDGRDDDCDGAVDEGCEGCEDGAERLCSNECGEGLERCVMDAWMGCDAPTVGEESCEEAGDEDCDGEVDEGCPACDEGETRACMSECGAGEERCEAGAWICDAPAPVEGVCPAACTLEARKPSGDVELRALGLNWFPELFWTGTRWVVFWGDSRGLEGVTRMAVLSPQGVLGESRVVDQKHFTAAAWTGRDFGVVTVEGGELSLLRVDLQGNVLIRNDLDVTRSGLDAVLAHRDGRFALVWSENLEELHFLQADDALRANSPVQLTAAPGRSMHPVIVPDAGGYMLAFYDERLDPEGLSGSVFTLPITPSGQKRRVEAPLIAGTKPALTPHGAGFAMAYVRREGGDRIATLLLDAEGQAAGAGALIETPSIARAPSIASTGEGLGVVWEDSRNAANSELYFAELDGAGALVGEPFRLTDAPGATSGPQLLHAQGRFGLTFFDRRAAPDDHDRAGVYFATGPMSCP